MPLRRRLALVVALVAAAVVLLAGGAAWITTRSLLQGNVDDSLRAQADAVLDRRRVLRFRPPADGSTAALGGRTAAPAPPPRLGGPTEYQQALTSAGAVVTRGDVALPVQAVDRTAVRAGAATAPRDVHVGDVHLRMITVPIPPDVRESLAAATGVTVAAWQFARPMAGVDSALRTLWIVLLGIGVAIVAIAAALGRWTARRVLRPVSDLADAAAHVEATADLHRRLPEGPADEVGELTRRFNGMLARLQRSRADLDRSVAEQRHLVADASHELRTPVTSLRTNAELLLEDEGTLGPEERHGMLEDVRDQAEDLGRLVTDLIELARGDEPDHGMDEPVALDALVAECVDRARRDHRGVPFDVRAEHLVVSGRPDRLARAVSNLVNNAALHGAGVGGGPVEVRVAGRAEGDAASGREAAGAAARDDGASGGDGAPRDEGAPRDDGPLWAGRSAPREAVVTVVDHGPGVPAEERERVFDRFRRGDAARGRHGSGLGLAIVRQVAVTHGGSVAVRPTPGGGATFELRLPLATDEGAGRAAE